MTDRSRIADEPAGRLARLPWITFHTRVVLAVGVLWVLVGMAAGAVAAAGLAPVRDPVWMGGAAAAYLLGEAAGVVGGGALARRLGRRRVLWAAVAVFVAANAVPAFLPDVAAAAPGLAPGASGAVAVLAPGLVPGVVVYVAARLAAGAAGGAEYAAALDAVGELIPRGRRTTVLLTANALFWLGGLLGAAAQLALAQPGAVPSIAGWRAGVLVAPALALLLAGACGLIPESPSWLVRRGRADRAAAIVDTAERDARAAGHAVGRAPARVTPSGPPPGEGTLATLAAMLRADRSVTVRALLLCASQGAAYGAVLFTLVALLTGRYGVTGAAAPAYAVAFALAGLVGAAALGRLLDPGGQVMPLAVAHMWVGGLLALTGVLLGHGIGSAWVVTLLLCLAFLVAAPSAILLVADAVAHYPDTLRRPAARVLTAVARLGGVPGPLVFGALLAEGRRDAVSLGYIAAALVMVAAGLAAAALRGRPPAYAAETPFAGPHRPDPYARPTGPPAGTWSFPPPPGASRHDDATR